MCVDGSDPTKLTKGFHFEFLFKIVYMRFDAFC